MTDSLIDFILADANLLVYKQSLSNLDRIALELEMLKRELDPINPRQMLEDAMDYTSSIALAESTKNPQYSADYFVATIRLMDAAERLQKAEAN